MLQHDIYIKNPNTVCLNFPLSLHFHHSPYIHLPNLFLVLLGLLLVYVLEELAGKVHQTGWQEPFTSSQPYQIGEG